MATYLIECWSPGAYYVGVSKEVERRLRRHWDDSWLDASTAAVKVEPNVLFLTIHGYKATLAVAYFADRAAAEKAECDWTYDLASRSRLVFGRGIVATCPGTKWLDGWGGPPWWEWNTVTGLATGQV